MVATLPALLAALDLEMVGRDRFAGRSPPGGRTRVFGGLIAAQALVASARTADGRPAHAFHGLFVLPGDPEEPFEFAVERLRDGGSFTARRCTASQHGRNVFASLASFHAAEPRGLDYAATPPDVAAPEALPAGAGAGAPTAVQAFLLRHAAVELRPVPPLADAPADAPRSVWMRAAGAIPDDPALHAAALAFMTDLTLLDTAFGPHGRSVFDRDVEAASLDHSLWFHRPARADDWLLYVQDSPSAFGARAFARGALFDRDGRIVASAAQDGLARLRPRE